MEKIGFLETYNSEAKLVEKSSKRRNRFLALIAGLLIAILSILPWIDVTLGDSLPMVIVLLAYSLGETLFATAVEKINIKNGGKN